MQLGRRPPVLIDECLPVPEIQALFVARGYEVLTVGEYLPSGATDPEVLAGAAEIGAIIVTHDTDFRRLIAKAPGHQSKLRKTGRIVFRCDHSKVPARLMQLIDDIEREYQQALLAGRNFLVIITADRFTVEK